MQRDGTQIQVMGRDYQASFTGILLLCSDVFTYTSICVDNLLDWKHQSQLVQHRLTCPWTIPASTHSQSRMYIKVRSHRDCYTNEQSVRPSECISMLKTHLVRIIPDPEGMWNNQLTIVIGVKIGEVSMKPSIKSERCALIGRITGTLVD